MSEPWLEEVVANRLVDHLPRDVVVRITKDIVRDIREDAERRAVAEFISKDNRLKTAYYMDVEFHAALDAVVRILVGGFFYAHRITEDEARERMVLLQKLIGPISL